MQFIIKIFSQLKQKFPKIHFQIIGDGTYKKNLNELIHKYNFQDQISLVGRVNDDQLREYYASCDLYTTASTWEFFNIPLLESMSCGKPILVSELSVHKEIILKSTAIVLPTYREGMPRVLIESMALGRVVIATDVVGHTAHLAR